MTTPEPRPVPDRETACDFVKELLADSTTTIKCASSSTIIDHDLKRTGRRAWRVVLEGTVDDYMPKIPEPHQPLTVGHVRLLQAVGMYLEHAHSTDGNVVATQQHGLSGVMSTITVLAAGDQDKALAMAANALENLPLQPGCERQWFKITEPSLVKEPGKVILEVVDKRVSRSGLLPDDANAVVTIA
jgi:hypothetical protein